MNNSQNPIARKAKLVVQEMPDEVLVYDLETNKAHCLNQTAAFVWKQCDGENTVADIVKQFEKHSGNKVEEDFVWLAIDQLNEKNLLNSELPKKFEGQSRRSVLKKIGLAAVIALPLVASLSAPTAALAVACSAGVTDCTGCNDGTVCTPGVACTPPATPRCSAGICVCA